MNNKTLNDMKTIQSPDGVALLMENLWSSQSRNEAAAM